MKTLNLGGLGLVIALLSAAAVAQAQPVDPIVADQAMVRLVPGADVEAYAARTDTTVLRAVPTRDLYLLDLPDGVDEEYYAETVLEADPDCLWVQLNYVGDAPEGTGRSFYFAINDDPLSWINQPGWGQVNLGGAQAYSMGEGMWIGFLDSGVDLTHPALQGHFAQGRVAGWNFVDQNADVADVGNGMDDDGDGDVDEMTGHGTHVAGLLAHVAPAATLLPIKVLDSEGNTDCFVLAEGVYYAIDAGVDVLNISIGSTYDSRAVEEAIAEARAHGVVVVASAGNMDTTQYEYPAVHEGVLGVAAVDSNDVKSEFSNYNPHLALAAPGTGIFSTIPGGDFAAWDGTSMATPVVAGAAALLLAHHPAWPADAFRADQVRAFMLQTAADIDGLNPDYAGLLGAGRLDAAGMFAAPFVLAPPVPYPAGVQPVGVVTAMLDADGLVDLAVANSGQSTVTLFCNAGDGTFVSRGSAAVGVGPVGIVAADFNNDGQYDLATANSGSNSVSLLINLGDCTFAPAANYAVGPEPQALAAADLDADGDTDLLVANSDGDSVTVLRHGANHTFTTSGTLPVGEDPRVVVTGDLTGDGLPDFATANRKSDSVSVYRNLGGATFALLATIPVGVDPRGLALEDFDGDGDHDLVAANHDSDNLTLLTNSGSGSFASTTRVAPGGPSHVAVADVNCDGAADLVYASGAPLGGTLGILLAESGGSFGPSLPFAVSAEPAGLGVSDLDGDGDRDLVLSDDLNNQVAVLVNFTCAARVPGDLNCDGVVGFDDINPFVTATLGYAAYAAAYPGCNWLNADVDLNGDVSFADVNPFVILLSSP